MSGRQGEPDRASERSAGDLPDRRSPSFILPDCGFHDGQTAEDASLPGCADSVTTVGGALAPDCDPQADGGWRVLAAASEVEEVAVGGALAPNEGEAVVPRLTLTKFAEEPGGNTGRGTSLDSKTSRKSSLSPRSSGRKSSFPRQGTAHLLPFLQVGKALFPDKAQPTSSLFHSRRGSDASLNVEREEKPQLLALQEAFLCHGAAQQRNR